MIYITADLLTVGDKIINGADETTVTQLDPCESTLKGVRKIHVNKSQCYDTLTHLEVRPARRVGNYKN